MPTTRVFDANRANAIQASSEYAGATNSPSRIALRGNTSDATGAQHPYTRARVSVAYGYGLTGAGVKVGIIDSGFNIVNGAPVHNEFSSGGKITVLSSSAPIASDSHGSHVSSLAVGDRNGTVMMGVAYGASLYLGMGPGQGSSAQTLTDTFNEYVSSGVRVASNSFGVPLIAGATTASPFQPVNTAGGLEVTAKTAIAYRDARGLSTVQMLTDIQGETTTAWTNALNALVAFQNAGGVIAFANSNYGANENDNNGGSATPTGLDDADLFSALPLVAPQLRGGWITVVNATSLGLATQDFSTSNPSYVANSTKKEGNIFLQSAQCGLAASFCLSMDGTAMWGAGNQGVSSYEAQTGTSQATPQVAGMIALLRQAFPTASAADLAARLMYTADNGFFTGSNRTISTITTASYTNANGTITHQVSDIWGHGFPNMEGALNPVGLVTARSRSGAVVPASAVSGTLQASGALGTGSQVAGTAYLVNDQLNGVFARSLGSNVAAAGDTRLAETFGGTLIDQQMAEAQGARGTTLRFGMATVPDAGANRAWIGTMLSIAQRVGRTATVSFGYGFSPDTMLGLRPRGSTLRAASVQDQAMGLPFLSFGSPIGRTWAAAGVGGGLFRATVAAFGSGSSARAAQQRLGITGRGRTQGMVFDATAGREGGPWQLNLSIGRMREQDGLLGSRVIGTALAGGPADSRFIRASFAAHIAGPFSLQGNYATALTQVQPAAGNLVLAYGQMRSDAAALALVGEGLLGRGTLVTLGASQPLRVSAGRARLDLPQAVRITAPGDYAYVYSDRGIGLAPSGREIDYMLEVTRRLGNRASLRLTGMAMSQPRHDASAPLAAAGLVSFRTRF